MYKDKDKQREAQRNWVRQKRIDKKGSTVIPKVESVADLGGKEHSMDCDPKTLAIFNESKPKRGKDIKVFADLPAAARLAIQELSDTDEEFKRRTAIAINYQHQFPDRFHSTGVAI